MTDTNNTGCARNQGTTQFCAEAVEAHKELRDARVEIKRLKQGLVADMADALTKMPTTNGVMKPDPIMTELAESYAEIDRLKAELAKHKEAT